MSILPVRLINLGDPWQRVWLDISGTSEDFNTEGDGALEASMGICAAFVQVQFSEPLIYRDLMDWGRCLTSLERGEVAVWRSGGSTQIIVEPWSEDRDTGADVTLLDGAASLVKVTVPVYLDESWMIDHRRDWEEVIRSLSG